MANKGNRLAQTQLARYKMLSMFIIDRIMIMDTEYVYLGCKSHVLYNCSEIEVQLL